MIEVAPKETSRAYAFEMWMDAPMPMVTLFRTINVNRLVRVSKRSGLNHPPEDGQQEHHLRS